MHAVAGGDKDASDKIVAPGDMIVLVAGEPPIYGKQPMYFLDPKLLERAQIPRRASPTRSFTRTRRPRMATRSTRPLLLASGLPRLGCSLGGHLA